MVGLHRVVWSSDVHMVLGAEESDANHWVLDWLVGLVVQTNRELGVCVCEARTVPFCIDEFNLY